MKVHVEKTGKSIGLKFKGSVKSLLSKLKINPETALVVRNNTLLTEDVLLGDDDEIKILSVVSGG